MGGVCSGMPFVRKHAWQATLVEERYTDPTGGPRVRNKCKCANPGPSGATCQATCVRPPAYGHITPRDSETTRTPDPESHTRPQFYHLPNFGRNVMSRMSAAGSCVMCERDSTESERAVCRV